MLDPIISTSAALALSVIFASAASHKLRKPRWFRRQVQEYRLAPTGLVPSISIGLPAAELLIAMGLLWPGVRQYAGAAALALIGAYAVAIGINLIRGRHDMDCGCSGPAMHQPLQPILLLRNFFLSVLALSALFPVLDRPLSLHDSFIVIAAGATVVLLYAAADLWLANRPLLLKFSGDK